jgi:translation initiation factor 1
MKNSRLVYSTETGSICPACQQPTARCDCRKKQFASAPGHRSDGIVRIRREVKGRRGKDVTTISGLPLDAPALKQLAASLKRMCGTGGSVKAGVILIQGDHRAAVHKALLADGFSVKLAGG